MEATTLAVADSPTLSPEINEIRQRTSAIVTQEIIPNEDLLRRDAPESGELRGRIQERVKAEGLWAPHLPIEYGGMGVGFLGHAYMNEVLAWSPFSNPLFGVVAPDSGNRPSSSSTAPRSRRSSGSSPPSAARSAPATP